MNLSEHFTLEEMIASDTAKAKCISNEPNDVELGHLRLLCTYILEPLRQAWGSPIRVTSGFRSEELNNAICGSKTSAHRLGYAADIQPANGKMKEFKAFVKEWLQSRFYFYEPIRFDQCIDERNASGAEWLHLGLMNAKGEMRKQFLITTDGKNLQTGQSMNRLTTLALFAIVLLTSCKTLQPIPTTDHRDSVRVEYRLDSVYLYERDSIYIDRYRSNDTIYLTTEKWSIRYKDKEVQVHDTITLTQEQTIVQTERYIPKFYKVCTIGFFILLILIVARLAIKIYKTAQTGGIL